jgi:hypothetical protein
MLAVIQSLGLGLAEAAEEAMSCRSCSFQHHLHLPGSTVPVSSGQGFGAPDSPRPGCTTPAWPPEHCTWGPLQWPLRAWFRLAVVTRTKEKLVLDVGGAKSVCEGMSCPAEKNSKREKSRSQCRENQVLEVLFDP